MMESAKPLFWVGSSRADLRAFPEPVREAMGFALWQAQLGRKHADAKPLKGSGDAGVLEVTSDHHGSTYRSVYTVRFANAVYVLHAFQKKSTRGVKTPTREIQLVKSRLKAAKEHYENRIEKEGTGAE
jgi:phage-related protein